MVSVIVYPKGTMFRFHMTWPPPRGPDGSPFSGVQLVNGTNVLAVRTANYTRKPGRVIRTGDAQRRRRPLTKKRSNVQPRVFA